MLSVQNIHLGQAENNENEIVHAARGGGRRSGGRRGASRSATIRRNAGRWALGAGAATAGIAIMGKTRLGRKVAHRIVGSKVAGKVRKIAGKVANSKAAWGVRHYGGKAAAFGKSKVLAGAKSLRAKTSGRISAASIRAKIVVLKSRLRAKVRVGSKTSLARRR